MTTDPNWQLVPKKPTEEMLKAGSGDWGGRMSARSHGVWQAMLAAAPTPPQSNWQSMEISPKLEKTDLLHQMNVLERELEHASWFTAPPQVKKITVEAAGGQEDDYEWALFEQIFKAARAFLEGSHIGCFCPHCNPHPEASPPPPALNGDK